MSKYINNKMRIRIYIRDSYSCRYCSKQLIDNKQGAISLDHVIPRCKGGLNNEQNLVTSCPTCQWKKGSRFLHETDMKMTELVVGCG